MKNIIITLVAILTLVSCTKSEPILQSELPGIWKLNGYVNSNYKMEITNNGYLYWFNYNDVFNKIEEFEMEYDINKNQMKLYKGNSNYASHVIKIYKNNHRLNFSIPITGTDANGNTITNTDVYYKMD